MVDPLKPFEVSQYVGEKRGRHEVLEYLLCFGGVPKYLEEFNFSKSIQVNIEVATPIMSPMVAGPKPAPTPIQTGRDHVKIGSVLDDAQQS